jgi:hypothetical protein
LVDVERRYRPVGEVPITKNLKRPKSEEIGFSVSHIREGVVAILNLVRFLKWPRFS